MKLNGKLKTLGPNVLGMWRNYGNHTAAQHIKTVYGCMAIDKTVPPGEFVSLLYTNRSIIKKGRVTGNVPIILIGTSATHEECLEWYTRQTVFEYKSGLDTPEWAGLSLSQARTNNASIDNDELLYEVETLGRTFKELSEKYSTSYINVYTRYARHKARLAKGLAKRTCIEMDYHTITEQIAEGMTIKQLAEHYNTSYQNVYVRYKRMKAKFAQANNATMEDQMYRFILKFIPMGAILVHIARTNALKIAKENRDKVIIITRHSKNPGVDVK